MRRLRQLVALPTTHRRLLFRALVLLPVARVALATFRFETLHSWAHRRYSRAHTSTPDWQTVEAAAWAIDRSARVVGGRCLAQAMVGEWLLRRRGQPATLRVGVAKDGGGSLDAHAWLEVDGRAVVGGVEQMQRYARFPSLDPTSLRS